MNGTRLFSYFILFALYLSIKMNSATAEEVRYLATPSSSLNQILDTIEEANDSLSLEYYIVAPCGISTAFVLDALEKKATKWKAEGKAPPRLLIDAYPFYGYYPNFSLPDFVKVLEKKGISVKIYNIRQGINPWAYVRNHRKLLIADKNTGITGGRNIGDDYFGMANFANYIDRDIAVRGSTAKKMQESFELFWNSTESSTLKEFYQYYQGEKNPKQGGQVPNVREGSIGQCLEMTPAKKELLRKLQESRNGDAANLPWQSCPQVEFVTDGPMGSTKERSTASAITAEFASAKENLILENYIYLPEGPIDKAMRKSASQGAKINIVTNGLKTVDMDPIANTAHLRYIARDANNLADFAILPQQGPKGMMWATSNELTSPEAKRVISEASGTNWPIHSKVFVKDGKNTFVGSYNLDARSRTTNAEAGVLVKDCKDFAHLVEDHIYKLKNIADQYQKAEVRCGWQQPEEPAGIESFFRGLVSDIVVPLL